MKETAAVPQETEYDKELMAIVHQMEEFDATFHEGGKQHDQGTSVANVFLAMYDQMNAVQKERFTKYLVSLGLLKPERRQDKEASTDEQPEARPGQNTSVPIRDWFAAIERRWAVEQDRESIRRMLKDEVQQSWSNILEAGDADSALEFYFRFVEPSAFYTAPYIDLSNSYDAFKSFPENPGHRVYLSGTLIKLVHSLDETEPNGGRFGVVGASIRSTFHLAIKEHQGLQAEELLRRLDDVNDPWWRLAASRDPAYVEWLKLRSPSETEGAESRLFSEYFGDITSGSVEALLQSLTNTNTFHNRISDARGTAYVVDGLHDAEGRFAGLVLTPRDAPFLIRVIEATPKCAGAKTA